MTRSQPVALLGEAPPRVLVAPPPSRANSWEDVADLSAQAGIVLDEWQELILQAALGERIDSTWAAKRVGLSVPRQNGKSQLLVARALAGALLFGEKKIVISAHQQDTARESFSKMLELIEAPDNGWLRERIRPNGIMQALNREAIKFVNGATIQFKARSGAGGRGFSSDCLMLDEAQILSQRAWVSINSTMSAMQNPQVWLLGTPPTPEDDGEVFASVRKSAISGRSKSTAWLEWAADPKADPTLDETRWSANPAWNTRINHEVVQGEYETYPPDRFALDRLGVWFSDQALSVMPNWTLCATSAEPERPAALGLAVDPDRIWISVGASTAGDRPHLGSVIRRRLDRDRAFVVSEVARIQRERSCAVVLDRKGPASSLEPELIAAGVTVTPAGLDDYVQACADLFDAVESGRVQHGGYEDLNEAVAAAAKRRVGDRWAWARRNGDVSMLEAVTLAMWGARQGAVDSVYEGRGLVQL